MGVDTLSARQVRALLRRATWTVVCADTGRLRGEFGGLRFERDDFFTPVRVVSAAAARA